MKSQIALVLMGITIASLFIFLFQKNEDRDSSSKAVRSQLELVSGFDRVSLSVKFGSNIEIHGIVSTAEDADVSTVIGGYCDSDERISVVITQYNISKTLVPGEYVLVLLPAKGVVGGKELIVQTLPEYIEHQLLITKEKG